MHLHRSLMNLPRVCARMALGPPQHQETIDRTQIPAALHQGRSSQGQGRSSQNRERTSSGSSNEGPIRRHGPKGEHYCPYVSKPASMRHQTSSKVLHQLGHLGFEQNKTCRNLTPPLWHAEIHNTQDAATLLVIGIDIACSSASRAELGPQTNV